MNTHTSYPSSHTKANPHTTYFIFQLSIKNTFQILSKIRCQVCSLTITKI